MDNPVLAATLETAFDLDDERSGHRVATDWFALQTIRFVAYFQMA